MKVARGWGLVSGSAGGLSGFMVGVIGLQDYGGGHEHLAAPHPSPLHTKPPLPSQVSSLRNVSISGHATNFIIIHLTEINISLHKIASHSPILLCKIFVLTA